MHTERQTKLITSSERHTLQSKSSKLIIFGHRLAELHNYPYEAHKKTQQGLLDLKRRKRR